MSQINLDTSPYFDDFDAAKDYYQVLFKPGFPVQARELTVLQSILQNQISTFGEHFFKEGSMVIPGSITYNPNYSAVILEPQQNGIDVSLYLAQLVGKTIRGEVTGITAKVINYLLPPNEGVDNPTIFVSYNDSGSDETTTTFNSNEAIIVDEPVTYGNTTITGGSIFGTTVTTDATTTGSAANISNGVYFLRGTFVQVSKSTVILEPYVNNPSYRVGLQIAESIVTAGQDPSLYDNAKGFNNFSAPGADRLKIQAVLTKKPLNDFNDTDFVELLRVEDGEVKRIEEGSNYNLIKDYIAQRTYDESGDYVVKGLGVSLDESLNDGIGNGGVYTEEQKTAEGGTPSDDLAIIKVSAGKAYVRGYDTTNAGTVNLDSPKPRTTENVPSTAIPFEMGSLYLVNNTYGTPAIGLDKDDNIVQLWSGRKNSSNLPTGTQIGEGRVYTYALEDAPYSGNGTPFTLYLFDQQIFTRITLNTSGNGKLSAAYRIKGLSSGAVGYVKSINGTDLLLTQTSGEFSRGEALSVNGNQENSFTIAALTAYKPNQVKSIFQDSSVVSPGLQVNFSADTRQYIRTQTNFLPSDLYTITSGGAVSCAGRLFNAYKPGDLVVYQKQGLTIPTINEVLSISANNLNMTVGPVASVADYADGTLPGTTIDVPASTSESRVLNQENAFLYAQMEESNIAKVDLSSSSLIFSRQVTNVATDANGTLTVNTSDLNVDDASFIAFDQERYSIHYADGTTAPLSSNQVNVLGGTVTFRGIRTNQTGVTANVTAIKNNIKSKTKVVVKSQEFIVNKISTGIGTGDYGMTQNSYYGLRVDDEEISLNIPDVKQVFAVYESTGNGAPTLDVLGFVAGLSLDTNVVTGELVKGNVSGAVGKVVSTPSESTVRFVYLSQSRFEVGERVIFDESKVTTNLQQITDGNYVDQTSSFTLDAGQREQFYDYSRLIRKAGKASPKKQLLVIFDRYAVPANDKGDFYTANSYDEESYSFGMPLLGSISGAAKVRAADTLDFRPRVAPWTSTTSSPFDYRTREFGTSGSTATLVIAPSESMTLGYDFYVGRKDRVLLDKEGEFKVLFGAPAMFPALPLVSDGAMELAQIEYPPYLYNVNDAKIIQVDNKRYTMRDIGKLETRLENLEEITSLSLLERETESLQVLDGQGNNRFKTGFFADDFTTTNLVDYDNQDCVIDVNTDAGALVAFSEFATMPLRLKLAEGTDELNVDLNQDLALVDANTTKTGDLVTLSYDEIEWIKQPLASRIENVNPFNVILYDGSVFLNPRSDDFVVTRQIGNRRIDVFGSTTGDFTRTFVESIEVAQFMRERNVAFNSSGIRPLTRFYPFFEGSGGIDVIPKLIEVSMRSGTFQVGETVRGFNGNSQIFSARVAAPNHKTGNFSDPVRTFTLNPYNREITIPAQYSTSSTILNVDTNALADISDDRFFGLIGAGVRLVGSASGAVADVSDVRLVSDSFGELFGNFFFRDPYANPAPAFRLRTGIRTFRLSSSPTDDQPVIGGANISFADAAFESSGTVQNRRTESVTIRDLPPPPPPVIIDNTVTNNFTNVIDRTVTINRTIDRTRTVRQFIDRTRTIRRTVRVRDDDPLAQTFRVDETGAFLTSVDIFMASRAASDNLTVQIRPTTLGTPENFIIQDYAEVVLSPSQVNISDDASVATNVVFPSPIYLEPGITYAVVLLAPTTDEYTAWIARMGEANIDGVVDVNFDANATTEDTLNNSAITGSAIISQQYLNGSLFKSQNGSIWTPTQFEDLKFTLYKAEFVTQEATVFMVNPPLGNQTPLPPNPITTLPRRLKVPVFSNTYPFTPGDAIVSVGAGATETVKIRSDLESIGGPAGLIEITDPGVGFVDGTYSPVTLYPLDSLGEGATVSVDIVGGEIDAVTVLNQGEGYKVGDTVGLTTAEVAGAGGDAILSVEVIGQTDTLYVTNVTGYRSFTVTDTIKIIDPVTDDLADTNVGVRQASTVQGVMNEGNTFIVNFPVHGMQSDQNLLTIIGVLPDTAGTVLEQAVNIESNSITVADELVFAKFEGITTSVGYAYLGGEIIEYTNNGNGELGILGRGIDDTAVSIHNAGTRIFPYEISGVSLRRINTTHELPINSSLNDSRGINTLPLNFDRAGRDNVNNYLNFNAEQQVGADSARASQNFQYNRMFPSLGLLTPGSTTNINGALRSVSGTSAGGNEVSFLDLGFQPITLNDNNVFDAPRLICSSINEKEFLQDLPQNKSFTLSMTMSSSDKNLSPVIDMAQSNIIFARSALNKPVSNYADDPRVNGVVGDPHSSCYISNAITLENPSTSFKVVLSAYRDTSADFRVLYRLFTPDTQGSTDPTWELFPGYSNMLDTDGDGIGDTIIDPSKNNGLPNREVRPSAIREVLEYSYEVTDLPEFSGFQIKIDFSGSNEARAPFIQDIRAIALA